MTNLLSVLHSSHASRGAPLQTHGVPLWACGAVALARVRASLLGSRWRDLPLSLPLALDRALPLPLALLLGVGVGRRVRLSSNLPYLVHRGGGLESRETDC